MARPAPVITHALSSPRLRRMQTRLSGHADPGILPGLSSIRCLTNQTGSTRVGFLKGLAKTRQAFFGRIQSAIGRTEIDEDTWMDLEAMLIQADLGLETTEVVLEFLRDRTQTEGLIYTNQLSRALRDALIGLLVEPPELNIHGRPLSVIMVVGVNGSGKTTTIAKLAKLYKDRGRSVMLAAGDTFRAAAIEQLQTWAARAEVPVVASQQGADPGAIVYDALAACKAQGADLLIIDTAGRLHSNFNLMRELQKISSVITKSLGEPPHEVLLVLDGTTGQNALRQAQKFAETTPVSGLIITKLDGTSKGGMLFSVYNEIEKPIQYIGVGESMDDLIRFEPAAFVDSLLVESE
jgi:fused signal recognition particle receptor